jgi:hypothetical protein
MYDRKRLSGVHKTKTRIAAQRRGLVDSGRDAGASAVGGAAKEEQRMNLSALEFHEIANEFPLLSEEETQQLADDIKARIKKGQKALIEPLMSYEEKLLDGRNRWNACKIAKYKLQADDVVSFEEEHEGEDPHLYVISTNIRRRHLTVSQRGVIGDNLYVRMTESEKTRKKSGVPDFSPTSAEDRKQKAAEAAHVGVDTIEEVGYVKKRSPEQYAKLRAGTTTPNKAAKEVRQQVQQQKITAVDEAQAWRKVEKVCGKVFVTELHTDQIPELAEVKHLVSFAKLPETEMPLVAALIRRSKLDLDHAQNFVTRYTDKGGLKPDWNWRVRHFLALMEGKETRQIIEVPGEGKLRVIVERVDELEVKNQGNK